MAAMITIKNLAKQLNLSTSTTSKALSDSSEIRKKTKTRVYKTANGLGYIPNHSAGSLKSKSRKTLRWVLPQAIDDFLVRSYMESRKNLPGEKKKYIRYNHFILVYAINYQVKH